MTKPYFDPELMNPYPDEYDGREVVDLQFHDPLIVRRQVNAVKSRHGSDDVDFILHNSYSISYRLKGDPQSKRIIIEVPRGMLTDLSSVPRFFRRWISQIGAHLEASIIHDFLYVAWQDLPDRGKSARRVDHRFADEVLLAGMKDAQVPWLKRFAIYWGVRLFGWPTFKGRDRYRFYDFWSAERASIEAPTAAPPYLSSAPMMAPPPVIFGKSYVSESVGGGWQPAPASAGDPKTKP